MTWVGIAVLVWVWASELFPTHLRGRSQGLCNAGCRLAISVNIFLVPLALDNVGFGPYMALLAVPMLLLALIVSRVRLFDSGQRNLEELDAAPGGNLMAAVLAASSASNTERRQRLRRSRQAWQCNLLLAVLVVTCGVLLAIAALKPHSEDAEASARACPACHADDTVRQSPWKTRQAINLSHAGYINQSPRLGNPRSIVKEGLS